MLKTKSTILFVIISLVFNQGYIFSKVTNLAQTTQAEYLWSIGLSGAGYDKIAMLVGNNIGPFDHSEFGGRMVKMDGIPSLGYTNHETTTAGIIIAQGLDPNAKGLAFQGTLKVYDTYQGWLEIEAEAALGLEIVSYSFGSLPCYFVNEARIDEIVYNYPQLLFVQAAGNATLSGQSKNNISIGSASYNEFGIVETNNSAAGPSNDGRIKPDIVAPSGPMVACFVDGDDTSVPPNGTIDENPTSAYGQAGPATSFAAPAVAGVSVLLQQHFQNNSSGVPMLASELKGLLIHSADEAGPANGPDAEFGWGLINAKRAAEYITMDTFNDNVISTDYYTGTPIEKEIYSDGTEPIKVTIVWTDPAATAVGWDCSDTSPRLINDLDIKLQKDGATYYPWTLDTSDPMSAAHNNTKNYLDNVEQVYIATPSAGLYTIQIDHTGALTNGYQNFSMIVSGNTTPMEMKYGILEYLEGLYPTGEEKVNKKLDKAIQLVESSLVDSLWEDQYYLTNYGGKVFNRERRAVEKLQWIVKDKKTAVIKAESQLAIEDITAVDKLLAQLAIDEAVENNGDSKKIEKANKQMEKAQKKIDKGKYAQAIEFYKSAWKFAQQALKKVGLGKVSYVTDNIKSLVTVPEKFTLGDNYPNPFNPVTRINYQLSERSDVLITVYNMKGQKVRTLVTGNKSPGSYKVLWNGLDNYGNHISTGIYFYELRASDFKQVKRMTFMK